MKKVIAATAIALGMSTTANAGPLEQSVAIDSMCAGVMVSNSHPFPWRTDIPKPTGPVIDDLEKSALVLKISAITKAQMWLGISADTAIATINEQVAKSADKTSRKFAAYLDAGDQEGGLTFMKTRYAQCEAPLIRATASARTNTRPSYNPQ